MIATNYRPARRTCPENLVDTARVIEVATRYPSIEKEALADRFGVSSRTIYNVLDKAGIKRADSEVTSLRLPTHPWRPAPRRKAAAIAMSREERQRLVKDYLSKNPVTLVPCGQTAMSDVIFADTTHE